MTGANCLAGQSKVPSDFGCFMRDTVKTVNMPICALSYKRNCQKFGIIFVSLRDTDAGASIHREGEHRSGTDWVWQATNVGRHPFPPPAVEFANHCKAVVIGILEVLNRRYCAGVVRKHLPLLVFRLRHPTASDEMRGEVSRLTGWRDA